MSEPNVPKILKLGRRGVRVKIWAFLLRNRERRFTVKEISSYLDIPLSTVQIALKDLRTIAPRIKSKNKQRSGRGRPEKIYYYQPLTES